MYHFILVFKHFPQNILKLNNKPLLSPSIILGSQFKQFRIYRLLAEDINTNVSRVWETDKFYVKRF